MVRELLSSPCWFVSTVALAFVVYAMGKAIYQMVQKRWSLAHLAKSVKRIERKLDENTAPESEPRPQRPRLVLPAAKRPERKTEGNVVYARFGKGRKRPPDDPPPGAA